MGNAVEVAVDDAVTVLAVAAAIVRYAVESTTRETRAVLPRLPVVGWGRPVLRRLLTTPPGRVLAHPAAAAVRALGIVADELVPEIARAVLSRLDVPALIREYVDVNEVAGQLDVNAVAATIDLDAIARRIDVDAIAAGLDLDTLVDKVDVSRVVDRVDLDAVVGRVDLDRAVEGVDIDRIIARVDIPGLARYVVEVIDLPALLRSSTGSVTTEMVRSVRDQSSDADRAVERMIDRLLRRHGQRSVTSRDDGARDDGVMESGPEPGHDDR